jgi:hypothetical protein
MGKVAIRLNSTGLETIARQASPQMLSRLMKSLLEHNSRGETCYYVTENGSRPFAEGKVTRGSDLRYLYSYEPDLGSEGWFPIYRRL